MIPRSLTIAAFFGAPLFTQCGGIRSYDAALFGVSSGAMFDKDISKSRVHDVDDDFDFGGAMGDSANTGAWSGGAEVGGAEALRNFAAKRATKTGTTIAGVVFEGGVVIGADTRSTSEGTVCDRNCDKIHMLASNMACCGAGTSADAARVTEGVRLALLSMAGDMQACLPSSRGIPTALSGGYLTPPGESGTLAHDSGVGAVQRQYVKVVTAAFLLRDRLFRGQGKISAALVLGGVDAGGGHVYQINQGGSIAELEYTAMGSGCLPALSVLERSHREGLNEEDAKKLVMSAIAAGIENDLGSGSNIDICVITAERGLEHFRGAWKDPGLDGGLDASQGGLEAGQGGLHGGPDGGLHGGLDGGLRSGLDGGQGGGLRSGLDGGQGGLDGILDGGGSDGGDRTRGENGIASSSSSSSSSSDDDGGTDSAVDDDPAKTASQRCGGTTTPPPETPGTTGNPQSLPAREAAVGFPKMRSWEDSEMSVDGKSGVERRGVDVGGHGGSRAWVGKVKRRGRGKRVVRVDNEEGEGGGELRSFRCSRVLDDSIEVL